MDREKLIQEVIQSRINSNNQIKEADKFISEYNEKQKRLNMESGGINPIMEELQSLSDSIEKQTEEEKIAEFEAYEKALEKVEKEKEKFENFVESLNDKLEKLKVKAEERECAMKQQLDELMLNQPNSVGFAGNIDAFQQAKKNHFEKIRVLKSKIAKYHITSIKEIEDKRRENNKIVNEARKPIKTAEQAARKVRPLLVKYDDNLKELEKTKETVAQLEQEIQENKIAYNEKVANVKALKEEIENNVRTELGVYTNTFALYCVCKNNFLAPIMKLIYNRK